MNLRHSGDPCASKAIPPFWSEWSSAGTCLVICGNGIRQRKRYCSSPKANACKGIKIFFILKFY